MLYLLGINLPDQKLTHIALTSLYGIGRRQAVNLCHQLEIHPLCRLKDVPEDKVTLLSQKLNTMKIDATLKKQQRERIEELYNIGTTRGMRHAIGLPVNGQRTRTNRSTASRLNGTFLRSKRK
ncbi:hypothetical protein EDD86DRAFT_195156 [Gorgonomyces haynaldii]|nr:hypothetical protein EDD86DRAFT_195156 [Gorgonomyces haynaldii]